MMTMTMNTSVVAKRCSIQKITHIRLRAVLLTALLRRLLYVITHSVQQARSLICMHFLFELHLELHLVDSESFVILYYIEI